MHQRRRKLDVSLDELSDLYLSSGSASGDFVLDLGDVEGGHVEAMTEERYSSSRLGAVTQIESTIQELGKIFQQLSSMVAQQGEMVQR